MPMARVPSGQRLHLTVVISPGRLARIDALALSDTTTATSAAQVGNDDTDVLLLLVQLLGHGSEDTHVT
jgi:hypothetical protein